MRSPGSEADRSQNLRRGLLGFSPITNDAVTSSEYVLAMAGESDRKPMAVAWDEAREVLAVVLLASALLHVAAPMIRYAGMDRRYSWWEDLHSTLTNVNVLTGVLLLGAAGRGMHHPSRGHGPAAPAVGLLDLGCSRPARRARDHQCPVGAVRRRRDRDAVGRRGLALRTGCPAVRLRGLDGSPSGASRLTRPPVASPVSFRPVSEFLRTYLTVGIFGALGAVIVAALLGVGRILRPSRPTPAKVENYESGVDPVGDMWSQANIRYYVFRSAVRSVRRGGRVHLPVGRPPGGLRDVRPRGDGHLHLHPAPRPALRLAQADAEMGVTAAVDREGELRWV